MIKINVDKKSEQGILKSLQLMTLPIGKRKKILNVYAKSAIKEARSNQRKQTTPEGKRWKTKKSRKGRRMLSGLARMMGVTMNDGNKAIVGWKVTRTAEIAYRHHHGIKEKVSRAKGMKSQND